MRAKTSLEREIEKLKLDILVMAGKVGVSEDHFWKMIRREMPINFNVAQILREEFGIKSL